ncbi:MAG TPA: DUF2877 domain-containing protein [Chloroflexota bacterium]
MRATLTAPALSLPAASLSAALLPPPGRAGRVHSIFRAAVNLEIESELIAVVARPSSRLPNGVHLADGPDFRAVGLRVDAPVLWLDGTIVLGDALLIDLRAAAPWSATLAVVGLASAEQLASALRRGRATVPPAPLLAWPCRALLAALRSGDPARIAGAAGAMIGLGPGLTPAGDDALLGCLAVLQAAGHRLAGALATAVSAGARRTTPVSAALLRHAAAGRQAEPTGDLAGALLSASPGAIDAALSALLPHGATSGRDTADGALVGLELLVGEPVRQTRLTAMPGERNRV